MIGTHGNDHYIIINYGSKANNVINDIGGSSNESYDVLTLQGSYSFNFSKFGFWLENDNSDLLITQTSNYSTIRVEDWFSSDNNKLDEINLNSYYDRNGGSLNQADVNDLVNAMNAYNKPGMGESILSTGLSEDIVNQAYA